MIEFWITLGVTLGIGMSFLIAWFVVEFLGDLKRRENRAYDAGFRAGQMQSTLDRARRTLDEND